jgi:hypothetical protein
MRCGDISSIAWSTADLGRPDVLIYSAWGDFAHALALEAGWWSVGAWLAAAAAFVVTAGVIANTRNELVAGSMVLAGPTASLMVIALLEAVADPTPGCAYECVGRLLLLAPAGGTFIGWGLGLVSGLVWRARRERPRLD